MPQWGAASGGVLCLWFCETELSRCSSEKSQELGGTRRFTLSDPCGTRINYTPESNRGGYISKTVLVSQARTLGFWKEVLTSLVVSVRIRSKSSTNCLKVGLCEGTACQQSLIIIYLEEMGFLGELNPWVLGGMAIKPVLIVNVERCPRLRKCIRTSLAAKLGGGIHFAKRGTAWFLWKALGFTKTSR